MSRHKLTPHCLATIFDSQLPLPKLSPKMPPKLSLAHKKGHFFLFQNYPRGEGNCETIERQKLSHGKFAPRHQGVSFGPLGAHHGLLLHAAKARWIATSTVPEQSLVLSGEEVAHAHAFWENPKGGSQTGA